MTCNVFGGTLNLTQPHPELSISYGITSLVRVRHQQGRPI